MKFIDSAKNRIGLGSDRNRDKVGIEDAFSKMLTLPKMVDTYYGDGHTSTFVIEKLKAWLNTRKA